MTALETKAALRKNRDTEEEATKTQKLKGVHPWGGLQMSLGTLPHF
jgi:hypothetical protein